MSVETVRRRLKEDYPFYARSVLRIVDKGQLVPFVFRPSQHELWGVLKAQADEGLPMRAIILKARKLGFSTFAQGLLLKRTTLTPFHNAIVIAHNSTTAGAVVGVAERMYAQIPEFQGEDWLKPPIANRRRHKEIVFGEADSFGLYGNGSFGSWRSSLLVDTAKEFEAGRGFDFHSVHGSEVGFWPDLKRKLAALENAVDSTDPNTLILLESTANGHNEFKALCDSAQQGIGPYVLFFAGWHSDPRYVRPLTARQRERFEVGDERNPYAEDEPDLLERYELTLEQLAWRRWAIENLCQSDINIFHQEYPSFPEEAFLATGQTVFGGVLIQKALRDANKAPEPKLIELSATAYTTRKTRRGTVEVPTAVTPSLTHAQPCWEIWKGPSDDGQYVIGCDPATGEDDATAQASFAIVVIEHQTRMQVAQFEAILEPDLIAKQLILACLLYAKHRPPWLAIERTGGYGLALIDILFHEYGWRQMYTRRKTDAPTGTFTDRLGWDTNRQTKGLLHEEAMALLREGTHGIQSARLARQMETYVRRGSGRTGPQLGARSDLLLAWMIAQAVASEKQPRVRREHKPRVKTQRRVRYAVTGY